MPLLNTSLPNLIQGVSQQPDVLRYDGQCEEQENALSSVVDGLAKRPNTRHLAKILNSSLSNQSFVHFVDQREDEKYVVIHDGTNLYAFNLDGTEATINGSTGGYAASGLSYIDTSTPNDDLKALSIADTTLILNTTTTVAEDSDSYDALDQKAFVFIKQGDYKKNYFVEIEASGTYDITGTIVSGDSTDAQNADTTNIAKDLLDGSGSFATSSTPLTSDPDFGANFTYFRNGNTIVFEDSTNDFTLSTEDGLAGSGILGIYKKVDSITSLPVRAPNNFVVEVVGDAELDQDNYYVKFETNSGDGFGEGSWGGDSSPCYLQGTR